MSSWLMGAGLANQPTITATGLRIQKALAGDPIPIGWGQNRMAPNVIWYGDFTSNAAQSGNKGGKSSGKGNQPSYSASSILALCEGPINNINGVFNSSGYTSSSGKYGKSSSTVLPNSIGEIPLSSMGYGLADGDYAQTAWPYMVTAHPTQALAYRGTCYVFQENQQLGNSFELPSINLDVIFGIGGAAMPYAGTWDANPADVLIDFLTNPYYGVPQWPTGALGDIGASRSEGNFSGSALTTFWNYTQANALWVSPILTDIRTAAEFIQEILKFCNCEAVWTQGNLIVVPYGDQSVTANGGTYTAPQQQIYDIYDDDLIAKDPDQSVKVTRVDVTQQLNDIRVCYLDRTFQYNPSAPMEAQNDAAIAIYGKKPNNIEHFDFCCVPGAAQSSAQLMLQRQLVTETFEFTVDQSFILLDPMDIVALYVPQLGLVGDGVDGQWVRIREIQENADYSLTITAEIYLEGTNSAPEFGPQPPQGTTPNFGVLPGNVNTPIFFEPTLDLIDAMEVWVAVSGQNTAAWGGCFVYISTDNGANYRQVPGAVLGPACMGTLATTLPTIAGGENTIDNTNTLAVNLSESGGALASDSQTDAQNLMSLCYVGGEYLAYANASAFASHEYNLTYLVRGAYGTSAIMNSTTHAVGTPFCAINNNIFKIAYNQKMIGKKIKIKFCSFNIVGAQVQQPSDVSPYTYTIVGQAGGITGLSNFAVSGVTANGANGQEIPAISVTWSPILTKAIIGVVIEYYVSGGSPSTATQQTSNNPAGGSMLITAGIQPNTTYEVRGTVITAHDNLLASAWTSYLSVTTPNILIVNPGGGGPSVPSSLTLANVVKVNNDGTIICGIAAGWTAVTSANLSYYIAEISLNGGTTWTAENTSNNNYTWYNLVVGTTVEVRVASVSNLGQQSAWSSLASITVTGQSSPPSEPTGLTALAGFKTVLLQWVNPTNPDFAYVNIFRSQGPSHNSFSFASFIGYTAASSWSDSGLTSEAVYNYWIQAINTSGNGSAVYPSTGSGVQTTTLQIGTTDITPNAITTPLLAAGSVVADVLAAGSVTANKVAANAITTNNIVANSITTNLIADDAVTEANIANLAVGTLQIAGNAVTVPAATTAGSQNVNPNTTVNAAVLQFYVTGLAGVQVNVLVTAVYSEVSIFEFPVGFYLLGQRNSGGAVEFASTYAIGQTVAAQISQTIAGIYTYTATGNQDLITIYAQYNLIAAEDRLLGSFFGGCTLSALTVLR